MAHDDATAGTLLAAHWLTSLSLLPPSSVDADAVFARVGLSRAALAAPGARIPASLEHQLWQALETEAGDEAVGLRIADQYVRLGLPSIEGYLGRNALTMREGLLTLQRFLRIADDRLRLALRESGERASLRPLREGAPDRPWGFEECMFAVLIGFARRYVAAVPPTSILLRRRKPRDVAPYTAAYGVVPRFGAPHSELCFPRAVLDLPVRGADLRLASILEAHAERLAAEVPRQDPFVQRVRALLADDLTQGGTDLARVSAKLAVSQRTLRRHLQARQTSYQGLLDQVRRDLACRLLAEGAPVASVAEQLGFQGPRALQKAFLRWTKLTPAQYRRTQARDARS